MDLSSARAVVSGGASGLGYATAKRIVDAGGYAVLLDVNTEQRRISLSVKATLVSESMEAAGQAEAKRPAKKR